MNCYNCSSDNVQQSSAGRQAHEDRAGCFHQEENQEEEQEARSQSQDLLAGPAEPGDQALLKQDQEDCRCRHWQGCSSSHQRGHPPGHRHY